MHLLLSGSGFFGVGRIVPRLPENQRRRSSPPCEGVRQAVSSPALALMRFSSASLRIVPMALPRYWAAVDPLKSLRSGTFRNLNVDTPARGNGGQWPPSVLAREPGCQPYVVLRAARLIGFNQVPPPIYADASQQRRKGTSWEDRSRSKAGSMARAACWNPNLKSRHRLLRDFQFFEGQIQDRIF